MTDCWHDDPAARPSFSDICASIEHIVDTAEHLPLPGQSQTETGLPTAVDQPSPTYSNYTFDSDDDNDALPLYRNCMSARTTETSGVLD